MMPSCLIPLICTSTTVAPSRNTQSWYTHLSFHPVKMDFRHDSWDSVMKTFNPTMPPSESSGQTTSSESVSLLLSVLSHDDKWWVIASFQVVGEDACPGLKDGFPLIVRHTLKVKCRGDCIPPRIEADISGMKFKATLLVRDLPLPEGCEYLHEVLWQANALMDRVSAATKGVCYQDQCFQIDDLAAA